MGFSVESDNRSAIAWMSELPTEIRTAVLQKMNVLTLMVKEKVEAELSGGMVGMRSGQLRNSLQSTVETIGDVVTGRVSSSSPYAGALNYGVHKVETVPATKREISEVFGSAKAGILADVRPHDRMMNIKGRDFMGLAAQDVQARFVQIMSEAVLEALEV